VQWHAERHPGRSYDDYLKGYDMSLFVRSPYNYDADEASLESGLVCEDKTRAQQSFKDECDINTIVKRFGVGYDMPEGVRPPTFADFEEVFDFQSAMNAVVEADRSFMALDADTRARFNNEPARFVAFCSDSKNLDEMRSLGLAVPAKEVEPPPPPIAVRVVPEEIPK
jgi:hypothetical protein